MMRAIMAVGAGGAIGASLRYALSFLPGPASIHLGTLLTNLLGCFLLAYLMGSTASRMKMPSEVSTALTTGLIGSFTTFSAFSVETVTLYQLSPLQAILYAGLSLLGGLALAVIGLIVSGRKEIS